MRSTVNRHQTPKRFLQEYVLLLVIMLLSACGANMSDSASWHDQADALNEQAYKNRYVSLSETERYAEQALGESSDYADGRYEALCHKAFVLSMRADYASAKRTYQQVTAESKNELLALVADVGLMELCQQQGILRPPQQRPATPGPSRRQHREHESSPVASVELCPERVPLRLGRV